MPEESLSSSSFKEVVQRYCAYLGISAPKVNRDSEHVQTAASSKAPIKSSSDIPDGYLDPERFVRTPLAKTIVAASSVNSSAQGVSESSGSKESAPGQLLTRSLLLAVDRDEYLDPSSFENRQAFFLENTKSASLLASGFIWRLLQYDKDLLQMYDPSVGMFPTQAMHMPVMRRFTWGGGARKPVKVKAHKDPRNMKGKAKSKPKLKDPNDFIKKKKGVHEQQETTSEKWQKNQEHPRDRKQEDDPSQEEDDHEILC